MKNTLPVPTLRPARLELERLKLFPLHPPTGLHIPFYLEFQRKWMTLS